jgi:hypothetical protein
MVPPHALCSRVGLRMFMFEAALNPCTLCLMPRMQSWELALFAPSAFLMITGALVYVFACQNEPVDFDATDNKPFPWEPRLPSLDLWKKS